MVMCPAPPAMVEALWRVRRRISGTTYTDVLRRTRRNAFTIRGVGPDVTIEPPAEVRAGARPYQHRGENGWRPAMSSRLRGIRLFLLQIGRAEADQAGARPYRHRGAGPAMSSRLRGTRVFLLQKKMITSLSLRICRLALSIAETKYMIEKRLDSAPGVQTQTA
jgi:hypothetical protein